MASKQFIEFEKGQIVTKKLNCHHSSIDVFFKNSSKIIRKEGSGHKRKTTVSENRTIVIKYIDCHQLS